MTCRARVMGGWFNTPEYDELYEWVRTQTPTSHYWDKARGITYLNGKLYPSELVFLDELDLLACKLRFPQMISVST